MGSGTSLENGTFYLFAPQARRGFGGLLSGLGSFRASGAEAGERVKALLRSSSADSEGRGGGAAGDATTAYAWKQAGPLSAGTFNDTPASYSLPGGAALVVRFALVEVAGLGLHHLQPNVHYEPSTRTACVFSGHLANLDELAERYMADPFEGPTSPSSVLAARGAGADPRQLAAEMILRMYLKDRGADPLVLLSELQGQFAFVVFDGEKRQVFAARDSSGSEPLFYELDDDGALSLSNGVPRVPADVGFVQWCELPPGHFISGRTPKVQQFALTPQQLTIRENYERSMDEEMSPRAFTLLALQQGEEMRRSLSPEHEAGGLDGLPVF